MSLFATLDETRQLGGPVVALFRTALGRDPDAHELAAFVPFVRDRTPLAAAARIASMPEFARRHGASTDAEFLAALCRDALGTAASPGPLAAGMAADRAELVALVADLALLRGTVPLLPGLAPGAAPDDPVAYALWVAEYDTPAPGAAGGLPLLDGPRVTALMSCGDTDTEAALQTVDSLRAQAHPHWELHLAARTRSPWTRDAIGRLPGEDARVRLVEPGAPWDVGDAELACVLAPGDRLAPSALHEVAAEFAAHPDAALVFTDEDVGDAGGRHSPRFKPGFSPDAPMGGGAVGQLAVCRAGLLAGAGGVPQRVALAVEPGRIRHIPAVLCHRGRPPPPLRVDAPHVALPDPPPPVTVIIPTKDGAGLLRACTDGVLDRTDYGATEVLVVDNGSTAPDALDLLARLEARPNVRVLRRPGPFNFAALNNAAAAEARGELLLLLNNDTEVTHPGWLREMAAHAVRPGVGAVGARLLYPNGTVQHAGILLGPGGAATHVGRGASASDPGYLNQLACVRDLSAVTAACMAVPAAVWRAVGGMDERLAVTWNDVDFCLRVRRAGLRVVWTPHATLLHHETATRGTEAADAAKLARFRAEQALARDTWGDALEHDPFLNPNLLATEAGPLALSRPRRRRAW